jgi:hypothetical protein
MVTVIADSLLDQANKAQDKANRGPQGAVGALAWFRSATKNLRTLTTKHALIAITLDPHRYWTPYTLARVAFDLREFETLLLSMASQAGKQAEYLGSRHGYAPAAAARPLETFEEAKVVDQDLRAKETQERAIARATRAAQIAGQEA